MGLPMKSYKVRFVFNAFNIKEDNLTLRTEELYKEHCRGLNGPMHEHISTTFGVTRNGVLNSLKYFHVTRGVVPDIMHDILEGKLYMYVGVVRGAN